MDLCLNLAGKVSFEFGCNPKIEDMEDLTREMPAPNWRFGATAAVAPQKRQC